MKSALSRETRVYGVHALKILGAQCSIYAEKKLPSQSDHRHFTFYKKMLTPEGTSILYSWDNNRK